MGRDRANPSIPLNPFHPRHLSRRLLANDFGVAFGVGGPAGVSRFGSSPDQFHYFLVARMVSERVEVRIVFDPRLRLVIGVWEQTFEQIEGRFYVA